MTLPASEAAPEPGRIANPLARMSLIRWPLWRTCLQRPTFFTGAVAENLAYGRPDVGGADIVTAAERAGVDAFIRGLPQGYETPIGEDGMLLSGGEAVVALAASVFRLERGKLVPQVRAEVA